MASTRAMRGYSLIEIMTVLAITITLACIPINLYPVFVRQQHLNTAYNTTLMALRHAHDQAQADMRDYLVTFSPAVPGVNGGTITVTQDITAATVLFSATLPSDVTFHIEPGIPTSPTTYPTTPDGFGSGANAFDFDQVAGGGSQLIYFYPDGSAQDAGPNGGNVNNGVVYLGIPGQLATCRAISLWGYTGRVRGWRLVNKSGTWIWIMS